MVTMVKKTAKNKTKGSQKKKISKPVKALKKPVNIKKINLKKQRRPVPAAVSATENAEKNFLSSQEVKVEQSKFYTPMMPQPSRHMPQDLPGGYGINTMILQVRDPWWMHVYWEVTLDTWDRLKNDLGQDFYNARKILRMYDISNIIFNGTNAHKYYDIEITNEANSWYLDGGAPGSSWCVDLGLKLPDGRFIMIIRSNAVTTPLDGPYWLTDEEWMIPEDLFARLYGMGFGFGKSSPVGKALEERRKRALFSGVLSSPGMGSEVHQAGKREKNFWLIVNCELIVHGATEPDAKVTVQDKPVKLRPDGTFTLRFALPDGNQVIPVKAVSSDDSDQRVITPVVNKETR